MSHDPCCQLHCHSSHSFVDGLPTEDELVRRAAELGQPGVGLTNHGNLFGAPEFFRACTAHRIKGIIGMEAYEAVPHTWDPERDADVFRIKWADLNGRDRYYHITLWALDEQGWENLCALHTLSWSPDYKPKNQPLIDRANLEKYSAGIMLGLGCMASRTNVALARSNFDVDAVYEDARWYVDVYEDRAFVEVMGNLPEQQALLRPQRLLARKLGLPTRATNDVHYLRREDGVKNGAHHVLVQARRWKSANTEESADRSDAGFGEWYGSDGFFMKNYADMLATGGLMDEEIRGTVDLLERSTFDFTQLKKPSPPEVPVPAPGEDEEFDLFVSLNT